VVRTIDWYLDLAREKLGVPSDQQLAKRLGITGASLSAWRTKRAWPSEPNMLQLATWCEVSPDQALFELRAWINADNAAGHIWRKLAGWAAAAGLVYLAATTDLVVGQFDVSGAANVPHLQSIHYATICILGLAWLLLLGIKWFRRMSTRSKGL